MAIDLPKITLADLELEERRAEARRYQAANEGQSKAASHWKQQLAIIELAKAGLAAKAESAAKPPRHIALIASEESSFPDVVTDDADLIIYSIDDRAPEDRVFQMGEFIQRVTPQQFDELLGPEIHHLGDKPEVEQAVRAVMNRRPNGKPALEIIKGDKNA